MFRIAPFSEVQCMALTKSGSQCKLEWQFTIVLEEGSANVCPRHYRKLNNPKFCSLSPHPVWT